jgi:hypothetical protein
LRALDIEGVVNFDVAVELFFPLDGED